VKAKRPILLPTIIVTGMALLVIGLVFAFVIVLQAL
jgi:hypothetical protein